jgi:hypothetical protein
MPQVSATTLLSAADECEAATRSYLQEKDTGPWLAFQRAMLLPIALMRAAAARAVSANEPDVDPPAEGLDGRDLDLLRLQCRVASETCRSHGLDPIVLRIAVVLDRVADSCEASLGAWRRASVHISERA